MLDAHRTSRIVALLLLILGAALALAPSTDAENGRTAVLLRIDGAIGPASADYLSRGLEKAAERNAALVVLRMDTPGGLDTSMRQMIRDILASRVPVATYVHPSGARAASAGTYILYASHIAAMAPGTNLGAATPVQLGGGLPIPGGEPEKPAQPDRSEDEAKKQAKDGDKDKKEPEPRRPGSAMEAKIINDASAYIRGLAELRKRNAEWAEKAVRQGASLAANEALQLNVITLVARNLDDLLEQAHGMKVMVGDAEVVLDTKDLTQVSIDPDWRTRLLAAITNPNVALILMMIGIYGLIFEFMNPGALYPGTIGAICLLVGLYALAALPVNFAGLGLMVLGLALMVAEAFTPSVGILGIGGAVAFVLGATILIDTDAPGFQISWPVIGGVAAVSLAFSLVVVRLALTAHKRGVVTGREEMIGAAGRVLDWNEQSGHIQVHGERWRARGEPALAPGQRVRVTAMDGLVLQVTPDNEKQN